MNGTIWSISCFNTYLHLKFISKFVLPYHTIPYHTILCTDNKAQHLSTSHCCCSHCGFHTPNWLIIFILHCIIVTLNIILCWYNHIKYCISQLQNIFILLSFCVIISFFFCCVYWEISFFSLSLFVYLYFSSMY